MTNPLDHNPQDLDDRLAGFADQALNTPAEEPPPPAEDDAVLNGLEQTVLRLKKHLYSSQADPAAAARIRNRVTYAWRSQERSSQPSAVAPQTGWNPRHWLDQLRRRRPPRSFALGFATVCLVLLAVLALISPGRGASLSGAAGGREPWLTLAAAGLLVGVLLALMWRGRR